MFKLYSSSKKSKRMLSSFRKWKRKRNFNRVITFPWRKKSHLWMNINIQKLLIFQIKSHWFQIESIKHSLKVNLLKNMRSLQFFKVKREYRELIRVKIKRIRVILLLRLYKLPKKIKITITSFREINNKLTNLKQLHKMRIILMTNICMRLIKDSKEKKTFKIKKAIQKWV